MILGRVVAPSCFPVGDKLLDPCSDDLSVPRFEALEGVTDLEVVAVKVEDDGDHGLCWIVVQADCCGVCFLYDISS